MSLNVLCGTFFNPLPIARHLRQARLIKQLNPDIICLQECNNFIIESVYTKTLANTHNLIVERRSIKDYVHRVINILIIATCFSYFCPLIKYVLLNPYIHNFIFGSQKIGNVIYLKKRFEKRNARSVAFHSQTGDILNLARQRGYTEFVLMNQVLVRNTHLNHQQCLLDPTNESTHQQIREVFSDCNQEKMLIVGDFNVEQVRPSNKFKDIGIHLGPTYRKQNPLASTNDDKRIDYIFAKNVTITHAQKLTNLESDHDAIYIYFTLS